MSLNDVIIQVMQYTNPYDVKNTFFVDKDSYMNTKDGRKYKYKYYLNGRLKEQIPYYMVECITYIHGLKRRWYENGQLWIEENRDENGRLYGVRRRWYESGQLELEHYLKDSLSNGPCRCWYENGQLESEENYIDEEKNGLCRYWDENGNLEYEETYNLGELV